MYPCPCPRGKQQAIERCSALAQRQTFTAGKGHTVNRPSFADSWTRFNEVNLPVAEVGRKLGGKVGQNIQTRIFENACPIRISYVLNHVGVPIPSKGYPVVSGEDGLWYLFRVNDAMTFLERTFGKPDRTTTAPYPADFAGRKGLLIVRGSGWSNARGHVTLWNGSVCSDSCHLGGDPDNGNFVPETAALWILR
jgi:hypothetical protein